MNWFAASMLYDSSHQRVYSFIVLSSELYGVSMTDLIIDYRCCTQRSCSFWYCNCAVRTVVNGTQVRCASSRVDSVIYSVRWATHRRHWCALSSSTSLFSVIISSYQRAIVATAHFCLLAPRISNSLPLCLMTLSPCHTAGRRLPNISVSVILCSHCVLTMLSVVVTLHWTLRYRNICDLDQHKIPVRL